MKLYTNDLGETLNRWEKSFYAWRNPKKGDKEIHVMKSQIVVTSGEGYLLKPGDYDFKDWEGVE